MTPGVQAASPWELGDQGLVGARACALTQAEAAELLGVLARSRTDDVPAPDQPDSPVPANLPTVAAPPVEPDTSGDVLAEEPTGLPDEYGKTAALVRVRLLGPMQITTESGELRSGLRASARSCWPTTWSTPTAPPWSRRWRRCGPTPN
jgi:hypothetical protein